MSFDKESDYDEATEIDFDGDIHIGLTFGSELTHQIILIQKS